MIYLFVTIALVAGLWRVTHAVPQLDLSNVSDEELRREIYIDGPLVDQYHAEYQRRANLLENRS
jgi:hypothetical protein